MGKSRQTPRGPKGQFKPAQGKPETHTSPDDPYETWAEARMAFTMNLSIMAEHVLPGHGDRLAAALSDDINTMIRAAIELALENHTNPDAQPQTQTEGE